MSNLMSPLKVTLLLEMYAGRKKDIPQFPAYLQAIEEFHTDALIDDDLKLTEKGRVYVEALLNVPLPVASWKIPD